MMENRVAVHLHLRQRFPYQDKYLNKTLRSTFFEGKSEDLKRTMQS